MKYIRWAIPFVVVLGCFILYASWIELPSYASLRLDEKGQLGDSFGVLNSLFSGLGFAAVALTIWIQRGQIMRQEQERIEEVAERRSLFNLKAALEATEQARELLSDHNNDRRTWIEAGRLLGHAKILGEGVTIDCHKRVLEANKLKYRSFFSELIADKPAAFFYGVDDTLPTAIAAQVSSRPTGRNGSRLLSDVRHLEEASIFRIWEAAQWPDDFDDPVGQTFSPEQRHRLMFQSEGIREYLEHREQFSSIGGQLQRRTPPTSRAKS